MNREKMIEKAQDYLRNNLSILEIEGSFRLGHHMTIEYAMNFMADFALQQIEENNKTRTILDYWKEIDTKSFKAFILKEMEKIFPNNKEIECEVTIDDCIDDYGEGVLLGFKEGVKWAINHIKSKLK